MTKGDIINAAFSRARISGLTRIAGPEDVALALDRLEDMAALWDDKNIKTGYFFENSPNPGTPHNVPRKYLGAYKANLAVQILADFGKVAPASLVSEAAGALSALCSACATVTPVPYPSRQPFGNGNAIRVSQTTKYFPKTELVKSTVLTATEIQTFIESFSADLQHFEDLTSYTLTVSDTAVISVHSDSLATPNIYFAITALTEGLATVTLAVTTTLNRVIIRKINIGVQN